MGIGKPIFWNDLPGDSYVGIIEKSGKKTIIKVLQIKMLFYNFVELTI